MTDERCARGMAFADLVDYWTGDLRGEQTEQIEQHIFACDDCARCLMEVEALGRAIAATVREAHFHGVVTDGILNRLARDGVRIRTYALEAGQAVPCAVWADDELVVTRLRANLSRFDQVSVVTLLANGEELGRVSDVPVRPGQREIIDAVSADLIRQLPSTQVRLVLSGVAAGTAHVIGEYVLEHAGAMNRPS